MLATILLLAQIVQPWPGLDSPLVQPGPTICVGECAGPVVWGPAERGRLVVACDMRSDTCSDGRKITTQRATPVPCETSPGVWEMVPENTGCYSVRGLESWAQNTSYLSWGAELDRSPWTSRRGGTVEKLPDGWRVKNDPNQDQSGWDQLLPGAASGEVWTSAYILRTSNDVFFRLWAGSSQTCGAPFVLNTGGAWRQFSCSTVIPSNPLAAIYPGDNVGSIPRPQYSVDVKAAWLTKSATPGRPCWGGEAPVTCAADRHTISTEGWPTESGEISLIYTPQGVGIGTTMHLVSTTAGGANQPSGFYLYRSASGALVFGLRRGDTLSAQNTQNLSWEHGRSYHVRVRWSPERAEIWRDGVRLRNWVPTIVPDSQPGTAVIGTHPSGTGPAQGSLRSLRVRSFE